MSWITNFSPVERQRTFYETLPAAPSLSNVVRYYWVIKCGAQAPIAPELLIPDGFDEIIFAYDSYFTRSTVTGVAVSNNHKGNSYIVGCKSYSVVCSKTSALSMVGIKLMPGVLHHLFGISMHQCKEQPLDFQELGAPTISVLEDQIHTATSPRSIKLLLDTHLTQILGHRPARARSATLVDYAIDRIHASEGACRISDLAVELAVSSRHLQKLFEQRVGITPKSLANIVRFKALYQALNNQVGAAPAAIEQLGIYDQSHLIREFRRYLGRTPKMLFNLSDTLSTEMLKICLQQENINLQ